MLLSGLGSGPILGGAVPSGPAPFHNIHSCPLTAIGSSMGCSGGRPSMLGVPGGGGGQVTPAHTSSSALGRLLARCRISTCCGKETGQATRRDANALLTTWNPPANEDAATHAYEGKEACGQTRSLGLRACVCDAGKACRAYPVHQPRPQDFLDLPPRAWARLPALHGGKHALSTCQPLAESRREHCAQRSSPATSTHPSMCAKLLRRSGWRSNAQSMTSCQAKY